MHICDKSYLTCCLYLNDVHGSVASFPTHVQQELLLSLSEGVCIGIQKVDIFMAWAITSLGGYPVHGQVLLYLF